LVAASDKKDTKNPKTQTIWILLGQEVDKITLLWVPSHSQVRIPENEEVENAARDALDENLDNTEEYPPAGLSKLEN
jgi:ribonuclease HI